jgi:multicomponent Na+:H+ antiporter subunit G
VTVAVGCLLLAGFFFHALAALGVIRLPDFYTRLHAVSKAETLGVVLTMSALVLWAGPSLLAVKLILVAVFLFLANPTSTHAIARAALRTDVRPWQREARAPAGPAPSPDSAGGGGRRPA